MQINKVSIVIISPYHSSVEEYEKPHAETAKCPRWLENGRIWRNRLNSSRIYVVGVSRHLGRKGVGPELIKLFFKNVKLKYSTRN